jgi:LemA protein
VKAALIATLAIAAALVAASEFVHVRKRLVLERNAVNTEWQQVDQALAHRAELIPSLEQSLNVLAGPADGIFRDLAVARADLASGHSPLEKIAANERLSSALGKLLVLTENYPKLRSDRKLLRLEEDIEGTENRIAVERRKYNEILEHYNSAIQMFPGNMVAALSGFARNDDYFHTNPGGGADPPVRAGPPGPASSPER